MKRKYLYLIIGVIIVILICFIIIKKNKVTITLNGDSVTIQEGTSYKELGYTVTGNKDTSKYYVKEENNINTNVPGEYYVNYYLYDENNKLVSTKTRKVIVEKVNLDGVSLTLIGDDIEYYFKGTYKDSGAFAERNGENISSYIEVISNVNKDQEGEYSVTYRIGNNINNIEKVRKVIIVTPNVEKDIDFTKKKIKLTINNEGYDYTILPDGIKESGNSFTYTYSSKDKYKFEIYLNSGSSIEYIVDTNVSSDSNIIASCTAELENNNTFLVNVEGSNLKKYQYNNQNYTNNSFNVSSSSSNIVIKVFDSEGNYKDITCKNIYGKAFKVTRSKSEKLGYAKCNTDVTLANIELEKIIQSYGERTRSAVAAAALFLTNYDYSISYQWGGKYLKKGLNPEWGCAKHTVRHNDKLVCTNVTGSDTCEAGLDCTGYTSWAFFQAGFDKSILRTSSQSTGMWGNFNASKHKYAFSSSNLHLAEQIKPGDLVWREGHVGIVIGVSADELQIANEIGPSIVQTNKKVNGASTSGQAGFTHFVLFDEFYNMYGSNT